MRVKQWIITRFKILRGSDGALIDPAERSDVHEVRDRLPTALTEGRLAVDARDTAAKNPAWGTQTGVAMTATVTLVEYTAVAGDALRGLLGTGSRDGRYTITINGAVKYAVRGNAATGSNAQLILPALHTLNAGDIVRLRVENEGQGSGNYEGGLLIE